MPNWRHPLATLTAVACVSAHSLVCHHMFTCEFALATEVTLPPVLEATALATALVLPPVSCRTARETQ